MTMALLAEPVKRVRDNQRQRVYRWENEALSLRHQPLMDLDYIRDQFVPDVWRTFRFPGRPPKVKDGRGRIRAGGGAWSITLPRWSRTKEVVLHELSHTVLERRYPGSRYPWHGPEFVGTYMILLEAFTGRSLDALKRSAIDAGVEFEFC